MGTKSFLKVLSHSILSQCGLERQDVLKSLKKLDKIVGDRILWQLSKKKSKSALIDYYLGIKIVLILCKTISKKQRIGCRDFKRLTPRYIHQNLARKDVHKCLEHDKLMWKQDSRVA